MKRKDFLELRKKDLDELKALLKSSKEELNKMKINMAIKKEKNLHAFSAKRHDIARIITVLKEKEILK